MEWKEEDMMNYDMLKDEMENNDAFKDPAFRIKFKKMKRFNEKKE